jgi:DNA-binding CsgD family transcriptional regulator
MNSTTPIVVETVAQAVAEATSTPLFRYELDLAAAGEPETGAANEAGSPDLRSLIFQCLGAFLTGRWDEAHAAAMAGQAAHLDGANDIPTWPFQFCQALLAAGRDADDITRGVLAESARSGPAPEARLIRQYIRHARALAAIGRGDFESAYQDAAAMSRAGTLHSLDRQALWVSMDLVEAAVRTNRRNEAAAHVTAMREANVAALSPRMALLEAGSAALAAPDQFSAELFEDAIAIPNVDRWPFDLARVRLAYGEHLRRSRAITDSRTHLSAALDVFRRLGASPWTARAANELRAAGEAISSASVPGTAQLTPQEHRTALLAATGLTNKEIGERLFLSPRTVGAHLYRVFPKLGVSTRAALRDALATLPSEYDERGLVAMPQAVA